MGKNYIVARVGEYTRSGIQAIQNHNDRKKDTYKNKDIVRDRSPLNEYLIGKHKASYVKQFDERLADGRISTSGLRGDATLFNEVCHDVNSEYWLSYNEHGYSSPEEFARAYFQACLEFDKKKFGEDKILSAVIHYDEINRPLTEKYGKPVWHYHMHVITIPTVVKEKRWTKRCKDPELVGKVKERITQVSNSKFWSWKEGEQKSYAQLQDDIYNFLHPQFPDLLRGESDSKAKHLSSEDYKAAKDEMRRLEAENELLSSQLKALQEEKRELQQENEALRGDLERLVRKKKAEYGELAELRQERKEIVEELGVIEGRLKQVTEIEMPESVEIPADDIEFINWCMKRLKGVFEAVLAFCERQYENYRKFVESSKMKELEAIKLEASTLSDRIGEISSKLKSKKSERENDKEPQR